MKAPTIMAIGAYSTAIIAANLLVAAYGPSVTVYNAFLLIGLDLVLRDYLHDVWATNRLAKMGALIAGTSALSFALNPATGRIAIASAFAFGVAALFDWMVYSSAERFPWLVRSNASNTVGAAVDSVLFPTLAFGALLWPIIAGQFIAKVFGGALWSIIINMLRRDAKCVATHN